MSRINTNVSSLVAQHTLGRNNADLQQALTRLSTGLRINTGADDPAGLIASENLRRDTTALNKAISNSERASQLIATADSALGQVSNLLNDIRGLVTEAANSGALSTAQINANQLQVDTSLEAIDRIAQVTTFQGRKLLDGNLDFITSATTNFDRISNLDVQQAHLGSAGNVAVAVNISTAATQAQVDITSIPTATAATNATADLSLTNAEAQASGSVTLDTTTSISLTVTALNGGEAEDADGNNINLVLVHGAASDTATYDDGTNTITIERTNLASLTGSTLASTIAGINGGANFSVSATSGGATNLVAGDAGTYNNITTGGRDSGSATVRATADTAGTSGNGPTVTLIEDATITVNTASASLNGTDLEVRVNGTVSYTAIANAISTLSGYTGSVTAQTGDLNYITASDAPPGAPSTLAGGTDAGGGLAQAVVFELAGADGSEVFSFGAGTSITQLESAIDALSEATGVSATVNGTTLELTSSAYGTDAFVDVQLISEQTGGTIRAAIGEGSRDAGSDVVANVNGIVATGKGNALSINTSVLDLSLEADAGFTGTVNFSITGGGALFQLGPEIVANQQARLGIGSVNTGSLGGISGKLYELRTGEAKSLTSDANSAARVVDEVITKVVELRGRLGAFERTTLQSNVSALTDTLANLTEAQATIRDADFAAETAALTRSQVLVQSGTAVLSIANQQPQNVLALLR